MKAQNARHEKRKPESLLAVLCVVMVFAAAVSLGCLRLYGLYLEQRLAIVSYKIEKMTELNAELEERRSALLSPARIYSIARSELNMVTARQIETVIFIEGVRAEAPAARDFDVASVDPGFWEVVSSFVGAAYAQD